MSLLDVNSRIQHSNSAQAPLYPSLDGLRGVAILMVVLGHYWSKAAGSLTNRPDVMFYGVDITSVFQLAGHGVQLFFVMSSFLLYLPYARATLAGNPLPNTRKFFLRRFLRIYPAYVAAIALYIIIAVTLGNKLHLPIPSSFDVITNLAFLHPFGVFLPGSTASPNLLQGTWSLVVEVYFYALLPFLAIAFRRAWVMLVVVLLMIGVAIYYRSILHPIIGSMDVTWQQRSILLLNPLPYLDCLGIGILSARLFVTASVLSIRYVNFIAPAVAVLAVVAIISLFRVPHAVPPQPLFAGIKLDGFFMFNALAGILIPAMLMAPSPVNSFFSIPILRFAGIVSYSVFLTHVTFANVLALPLMEMLQLTSFSSKLAFLIVIFVPVAIVLGLILYMLFERPWLTREPILASARDLGEIIGGFLSPLRVRTLTVGFFAWYGATVLFYHGLPGSTNVPEEVLFRAANLTDKNWSRGVSRTGSTILVVSDKSLVDTLKDKKILVLEDGTKAHIQSLEDAGNGWVHLRTSKVQPSLMAYPRRLIAIR